LDRTLNRATRKGNSFLEMDELDQLLQELSAPKPVQVPAPQAAPMPQVSKVQEVEAPKPKTVDFNELDDLMAELGGGSTKKETPKPTPAPVSAPAPVATPTPALAPTPAPAPVASAPAQQKGGAATVDDLLAELTGSTSVAPSQHNPISREPASYVAAVPTITTNDGDDLDSVMNALQGLQTGPQKTPALTPAPAASNRKNELDNILNSLSSEMNQIGVDSEFKGQCARCKKAILGQVVTALGKTWHQECFSCFQCRKPLGSSSFFEKDSNPFCEKCFHDFFSPKCAYCDGPIRERCINALGRTWHPDHFFCSQCGKNFAGGGFMEKDGKAYCEEDYFNMFAPKCGGCEKPIMAECITALGRQWHPNCFVCMECKQSFGGGSFFDHEGKPYCEKHYHLQRGSLCASCQKPVLGRCITAIGKRFHPEHFVCAFCMKQLAQGTFKENSSKPYCLGCHVKLFG